MKFLFLYSVILFHPDVQSTRWVQNSLHCTFSDDFFEMWTMSASKKAVLLGSLVYFAAGDTFAFGNLKSSLIGGAAATFVVQGIKYVTQRRRPDGSLDRWNSAFPSGHAALSSFVAVYYGEKYPDIKPYVYIWPVLVGLSRIYLNRHWTSDVVAGILIGSIAGEFTAKYDSRLRGLHIIR